MKNIYVLWVRHCISCSNVAEEKDIEQRYRKEPLCTSEGIVHAIVSGDRISKYIKRTFPGRKVKIFSSFLPRAMETAKLISSEMIDHGIIEYGSTEEIRRLPFISELWSNYEIKVSGGDSSTSTTTREKSDAHAHFLNTFFPNLGLKIDLEDSRNFLEIERECPASVSYHSRKGKRCKLDMKECYKKFLSHFVLGGNRLLSEEDVNVIVSHGAFIEKYIIMPPPKQTFLVDNVDSALVVYEVYDEDGEDNNDENHLNIDQKLLHYLKSPSNSTTSDRRIILKLNSYEIKNILKSKFANCEYTYDDIYEFSR